MSIKKYKDWAAWRDGLRTAVMKAGATSVVTNLSVLVSTNVVSSLQIPGITNTGEGWRTFVIGVVAQFMLHTVYAAAQYVQANPTAVEVTEEVDTQQIKKP